jgi:hypothetical protein
LTLFYTDNRYVFSLPLDLLDPMSIIIIIKIASIEGLASHKFVGHHCHQSTVENVMRLWGSRGEKGVGLK